MAMLAQNAAVQAHDVTIQAQHVAMLAQNAAVQAHDVTIQAQAARCIALEGQMQSIGRVITDGNVDITLGHFISMGKWRIHQETGDLNGPLVFRDTSMPHKELEIANRVAFWPLPGASGKDI